jgi:hypothetical protein
MFAKQNIQYIVQLPIVKYDIPSDKLNSMHSGIKCDKEWDNYIKKMIKANRKNEKKAMLKMNRQQELPTLNMPNNINFDSINDEIF